MFVGETGIGRIVQRSVELLKKNANGDVRAEGGIDFSNLQRYLNFWYTRSLDLFGGEISTNAASFFASGLKGRAKEEKFADHLALEGVVAVEVPEGGKLVTKQVAMRTAMNDILRDGYVEDCQRGVDCWNKILEAEGIATRLRLPSRRFNREQGNLRRPPL